MWCVKRFIYVKKIFWNPATCNCENGKYLASIMDDSAIMCDEVIESYKEDAEAKSYQETKFLLFLIRKYEKCKRKTFSIILIHKYQLTIIIY